MTPTGLLNGQILICFGMVILGMWAATQWAAAMLGYALSGSRNPCSPSTRAGQGPPAEPGRTRRAGTKRR